MSKVSIVIPIYNTSEYLRECLDSVVNQTLKDIEIILVDDGSTDGSVDICREYMACDSRIKLIEKENGGAAAARRMGAMVATSPYIGFVDSDDMIEADMYETLLEYMGDCDLVTSAVYKENGTLWKDYLPTGIYSTSKEMQYVIENMLVIGNSLTRGICGSMVCKMFKTDLSKKVFNSVNLKIYSSEDTEFIYKYILYCNSIRITDICKYKYRNRGGSLVHSVHHDYLININLLYLSLREAFIGHQYEERLLEQLQMLVIRYVRGQLTNRMGFSQKARILKYMNPLIHDIAGKRVALYGAGKVGKDYYLHMVRMDNEPVIWVDQQYEKYEKKHPVRSVEELEGTEHDILMIAVKDGELAERIKGELLLKGIRANKILWKEPIKVV